MGTVCEIPTRGLPVPSPTYLYNWGMEPDWYALKIFCLKTRADSYMLCEAMAHSIKLGMVPFT
jgi:hypothetical protein